MPYQTSRQTAPCSSSIIIIIALPRRLQSSARFWSRRRWRRRKSAMACAVVCSPHHRSHISTSDVPKQDFFSGKCDLKAVPMRRSSPINAAIRSESFTDFQTGRYSNACVDKPCAPSCPVIRETNVERWVEESVHEIVRNIQEAPFLQYVFNSTSNFRRYSHRQRLAQECFQDASYWPSLKASFSKADPDGVILVQKLQPGCASCCLGEDQEECPLQSEGAETNIWGVFVQARGVSANACYLLKTTRVASSAGACTRYCLTRATCFGPSYVEQLENAWLL